MADESEQQHTHAQVWEAVRRLSDAELERMQQRILTSSGSSSSAPQSRKDAVRIPLTLMEIDDSEAAPGHNFTETVEDNQADNDTSPPAAKKASARLTQWSPSDLIHAFLEHLHHAVHSQQAAVSASAGATAGSVSVAGEETSGNKAQRTAKSTNISKSSPFALQSDDFPSLLSASQLAAATSAKTPGASHKPNVKATKRRITTTLLSDQNVITRPVLHAVAFPPLGGGTSNTTAQSQSTSNTSTTASNNSSNSNPWAKQELLERRMMSSVEQSGGAPAAAIAEFPAQSPVLTKSRVGNHHDTTDSRAAQQTTTNQMKNLFDDSPPGGPKRVQPFPMASSVRPDPVTSCQSPVMVTTPLKTNNSSVQQPPPMLLCVKPKRRQSLLTTTTSESNALQLKSTTDGLVSEQGNLTQRQQLKTAQDFAPNLQAAKLYAFLIAKRFVGSTCAELQLLISLLFRTNCAVSSGPEVVTAAFDTGATFVSTSCTSPSEFCWRGHCLAFAAAVLDGIEPILGSLGSELLQLLTSSLADADICAEMLARLQQLAQRREELRVEESARLGCKLPVETRASAVRDFALPFCEEMDSRLHYRSPTESVLYSNREKVRDSFLDLLRLFQKQQHSLLGIESANVAVSAVASANNLLSEVSPENRWWFAKFFVLELIQVGANPFGESDKDLVLKIMGEDKLVVKNPDRLRKLHRRFSSQKQSTKAPQTTTSTNQGGGGGGGGGSGNNSGSHTNKNHSGGSSFSNSNNSSKLSGKSDRNETNNNSSKTSPAGPSSSSGGNSTAITATFETTRGYFAENQQFFFHFLYSCDSYEFSQLVKYQLEAQFQAIWKDGAGGSAAADARKSFTDVVLKLKVVAKFLGYLRFSPHWHNSSSLVQLSKQNPAFQAAKKEAIWTLENAESVGLDVKLLLEQSVMDSKLSKCIPWLCDYLTMLSLDKLSLATTYFKQLLVLLERIYHSKRLDTLGETGLYIAMQIERVFHVLDFDVAGFLDDAQLRSLTLQPPASLLLALENVEPSSSLSTQRNSSNGGGEDTLPFLYSQVFVQSCVSELEDLRGFIQTRAMPSHRVTKLVASGGGGLSQTIPIRKLRPLQVVTEEEHNDELLLLGKADATSAAQPSSSSSSSSGSFASTLSDDDKLSESIFKIHPNLRKVVEFVVEVVTTNICEHVLQQIVTPGADAFISSCVSESGLNPRGSSSAATATAKLDSATILFLQLLENRTARTIHESVSKSLAEANRLCEDKVRMSVPPLIPPSCHPTLAKSVTLVALNRTRGVVRNLIPKSSRSEFLKRLAFRKKAILKETATKSAAQASSAVTAAPAPSANSNTNISDEDNVVRTLSTMFDEHAGVEDSTQDEILLELKQTSAQIFKLCGTRHAKNTPDECAKLHASLSRQVRSFTSSLEELESEISERERPENDPETTQRKPIHELPVWDATWRVLLACLRVITRLAHNVADWVDGSTSPSQSLAEMPTKALEKAMDGFADSFISLLTLVLAGETCEGLSHEEVESRRIGAVIRVVTDSLLSTPASLQLEPLEHSDQSTLLVQRLVLTPRTRILTAIASLMTATSSDATTTLSPHASKGEQSKQKAADFQSESLLSAALLERLRARDC